MSLPKVIRNFNAFVDGISYFGKATTAKLPQPKIQTEAHRGAGMDGPVGLDMGVEGMTSELTFAEWDPVIVKKIGTQQRIVLRPAAQADGDVEATAIIATIGGLVTTTESGDLNPGQNATLRMEIDVRSYKLEIGGETVIDIDMVNAKRVIGGVDQLAAIRKAMGI